MSYLSSLRFRDTRQIPAGFPFELPIIESLSELSLSPKVTFFVGENGSGKSTLLEAIAVGMKCPTVGAADATRDPMLADARRLAAELTFVRHQNSRKKLFFRAEDAIGFTKRVQTDMAELEEMSAHYEATLKGYAKTLAQGVVQGQKAAHSDRYGENPDARSHGEWFLEILQSRLQGPGLFLLDEPETPLSPIHQLTLLSLLMEKAREGSQFIIATHSPILMALPDALILQFDQQIQPVNWENVEHVEITKAFLNDPESFIRHL